MAGLALRKLWSRETGLSENIENAFSNYKCLNADIVDVDGQQRTTVARSIVLRGVVDLNFCGGEFLLAGVLICSTINRHQGLVVCVLCDDGRDVRC